MQIKKRILSLIAVLVICLGTIFSATACSGDAPFTVWFEAEGGTLVKGKATQQVTSASQIVEPTFERENYEFVGWDTDVSKIDKHTSVKAVWRERYFLSFDNIDDVISVYPNQPIGELPTLPNGEDGKRFNGWTVDSQKITKDDLWIWQEDKEARAIWLAAEEYTIELFYQGGIVEEQNRLTYTVSDETFTINNPTKEGYEFAGWVDLDNPDGGKKANIVIEQGSTGNKRYIAQWNANTYKINFNAQSGEVEEVERKRFYDQEIGELPVPTNGNVTFLGWYCNGEKVEATDLFKYTGDVEFVAKWQYVITFQLWSQANAELRVDVQIIGGNPEDIVVDSDYVVNSDFPPADKVKLLNVDVKETIFYGWTVNNKKFDGSEYAYAKDITVEELMISLKTGTIKEQLLRKEILEEGVITVIARSKTFWSSGW